jgi:hypothetical protein
MVNPDIVLVETVVDDVLEKAQEVVQVVEQVEEVLTKKSWSCWAFGWNIVATKSPALPSVPAVSNTDSKD